MTNDPIEEVLRLPISMSSKSIDFSHHQATEIWLRAIGIGHSDFRNVHEADDVVLPSLSGEEMFLLVLEQSESDDHRKREVVLLELQSSTHAEKNGY